MNDLSKYTEQQLLQELLARKYVANKAQKWCDDCIHFKISINNNPDNNNCIKQHKMKFQQPTDYGDEYGFYRVGCKDMLNNQE